MRRKNQKESHDLDHGGEDHPAPPVHTPGGDEAGPGQEKDANVPDHDLTDLDLGLTNPPEVFSRLSRVRGAEAGLGPEKNIPGDLAPNL